ncbi:MAG: hypothetical protein ACRDLV_11245, partial [Solirubrobacteraceae bacterium]
VALDRPGGGDPLRLLGLPIKLSRTPGDPARALGPELGEHTDEVLEGAGYSSEEIRALHATGAVAGPPADLAAEPFLSS